MSTARIGVCSWSLRPASAEDLAEKVRAAGLERVQIALADFAEDEARIAHVRAALAQADVAVRSGMLSTIGEDYSTLGSIRRTGGLRPDEHWEANLARAQAVAGAARRFGLSLVSFHAGFLPESRGSRERESLLARLRQVVDLFADERVRIALETGQERAEVLLDVLAELDRPTCGVNFDPANMILYGMGDPVAALALLAPHVLQIHVKDARASKKAGAWGQEVPVGTGEVDWPAFFGVVREKKVDVDLMIEREAGEDRVGDIARARVLVERELARIAVAR
jgi:sugar phosphate isomerase/epimerase